MQAGPPWMHKNWDCDADRPVMEANHTVISMQAGVMETKHTAISMQAGLSWKQNTQWFQCRHTHHRSKDTQRMRCRHTHHRRKTQRLRCRHTHHASSDFDAGGPVTKAKHSDFDVGTPTTEVYYGDDTKYQVTHHDVNVQWRTMMWLAVTHNDVNMQSHILMWVCSHTRWCDMHKIKRRWCTHADMTAMVNMLTLMHIMHNCKWRELEICPEANITLLQVRHKQKHLIPCSSIHSCQPSWPAHLSRSVAVSHSSSRSHVTPTHLCTLMSVCWIWATNIHVCRLNAVIAEGIIRRKKADAKPRCLATPSWREVNHLQTWPRPKPRFHDEKRHHDDTAQPIMHTSYDIYRVFCTPRFHGDYRHSWRSCEWMPCMPYFIGSKVCPK